MNQHPRHGEHMNQRPPHGERVKHPRHGDGANCTKKDSSPANPILDDDSTATSSDFNGSPRSSFTVDEVTTIALGMRQLNDSETYRRGYVAGATETARRLRTQHARELKEAEYRGQIQQLNTRQSQMMANALTDAAIADRCPRCNHVLPLTTGHGDTEGAR